MDHGQSLSPEAAERWSLMLCTREYRSQMLKAVAPSRSPELETLPPFAQRLPKEQNEPFVLPAGSDLMFRGFSMRTWTGWRAIFEYRLVDPARHRGAFANYAGRRRGSEAVVLSPRTVIYRSKWHARQRNVRHRSGSCMTAARRS